MMSDGVGAEIPIVANLTLVVCIVLLSSDLCSFLQLMNDWEEEASTSSTIG